MFTDADRDLARFAAEHDSVFRLDDARRAGLTERQIRRRCAAGWEQLFDGVYRMPGAAETWQGRLRSATWAAGAGSAISHRSAGAFFELPGGRRDLVELTCRRWQRTIKPGLVVHESRRLEAADVQLVCGIAVTRPERTVFDLAWLRPSPNYLEAVMQAARRHRLITYDSMFEMFNRHARRGVRGVKALRVALERWNPNQRATESEMETTLFQMLRERGLPEPIVQYEVHDEHGRFVARTEFGWPLLRATLDYDSKQEHSDEFQLTKDARRRNAIIAAGYLPLTARLADVRGSAEEICEALQSLLRKSA
jgi:hypothetical protein